MFIYKFLYIQPVICVVLKIIEHAIDDWRSPNPFGWGVVNGFFALSFQKNPVGYWPWASFVKLAWVVDAFH